MINNDVKVHDSGAVVGTFPYVTGFTGFNAKKTAEQEGWYFPFKLSDKYQGKKITVKRESGTGGTAKTVEDCEWVLRLTDGKDTIYTIKTEGEPIITLSFSSATFNAKSGD